MFLKQISFILESFKIPHKVQQTDDPTVEDHAIILDDEFHLQVGAQEQYLELIEEIDDETWSSVVVEPHQIIPVYRLARKIRDLSNQVQSIIDKQEET